MDIDFRDRKGAARPFPAIGRANHIPITCSKAQYETKNLLQISAKICQLKLKASWKRISLSVIPALEAESMDPRIRDDDIAIYHAYST